MSDRTRHVVAFYEIDRAWGGPEEGGWWYDCGELARVLKVVPSADAAHDLAARANRLMDRLQRGRRDVGSVSQGQTIQCESLAKTARRMASRRLASRAFHCLQQSDPLVQLISTEV